MDLMDISGRFNTFLTSSIWNENLKQTERGFGICYSRIYYKTNRRINQLTVVYSFNRLFHYKPFQKLLFL